MKLVVVMAAAILLAGCATGQGVIGGGKPTQVKCKGKGMVSMGVQAFQADCGDGFEFSVNIQ